MDCSTPGSSGFHCLLEFAQIHVHWGSDTIWQQQIMSTSLLIVVINKTILCNSYPKWRGKMRYVSPYSFFCVLSDTMCFRMPCPWNRKSKLFAESSSFPGGSNGKESACQKKKKKNLPAIRETGFNPWVRKILWRRERQSTPAFLPGEFQGQRSLAGYSPWSRKELQWLSDQSYWTLKKEFFISPFVILFFRLQPKCNTACLTVI